MYNRERSIDSDLNSLPLFVGSFVSLPANKWGRPGNIINGDKAHLDMELCSAAFAVCRSECFRDKDNFSTDKHALMATTGIDASEIDVGVDISIDIELI